MSPLFLALPLCLTCAPPTDGVELPPGVLAYEPFDLEPGERVWQSDGGAGWDSPWERSSW